MCFGVMLQVTEGLCCLSLEGNDLKIRSKALLHKAGSRLRVIYVLVWLVVVLSSDDRQYKYGSAYYARFVISDTVDLE